MGKGGVLLYAHFARGRKFCPATPIFIERALTITECKVLLTVVELTKSVVGWVCCVGLQRYLGAPRTVSWRRESQGSHEPSHAASCEQ